MKTYVWIIILICLAGIAGTFTYLYIKAKKNCGCAGSGKNVGSTKTETDKQLDSVSNAFGRNAVTCVKKDQAGNCIQWKEGADTYIKA